MAGSAKEKGSEMAEATKHKGSEMAGSSKEKGSEMAEHLCSKKKTRGKSMMKDTTRA
jgi:hypothetical protein